jgi:3-dehydro-L-gulonate 2-dehydrogenase
MCLMLKIPFEEMKTTLSAVLLKVGFSEEKAAACATIFAENSLDGVYTHGLNRFPVFVEMIKLGLVKGEAEPELESLNGLIEQWNGNLAPGMLNAKIAMERAIQLAEQHGIGCVAMNNTNHWMRGGTYGWQAADAGYIGICFTNTIANMPPWAGVDPRLGNNPLVIGVPREQGNVVLDMAISQFSFGKLLEYQTSGDPLPFPGGYDKEGDLSTNASDIIESNRLLPIGFWKGSGLSLMLDILVTVLSQGRSTKVITEGGKESGISQVFISIKVANPEISEQLIEQILAYTKSSTQTAADKPVRYPGENTLKTRIKNQKEGVPVNEDIWKKVKSMLSN